MSVQAQIQSLKGGEFLIKESLPEHTFIPEQFGEDALMVANTALDFLNNEVRPVAERIEKQEEGLSEKLMVRLGDLGFLGIHMPETYGGTDLDTNTNTLVTDILGPMGSFSTTYAAHTGIGMLPILYFA